MSPCVGTQCMIFIGKVNLLPVQTGSQVLEVSNMERMTPKKLIMVLVIVTVIFPQYKIEPLTEIYNH